MAAAKNSLEAVRRKVVPVLRTGLKAHGINPRISSEAAVNSTKWRFCVISDDFSSWLHAERDEAIGRILRESLEHEELLKVTMVLPLTGKEAQGDFS